MVGRLPDAEIARLTGRNLISVASMRHTLKRPPPQLSPGTPAEPAPQGS
jgi:hypothetical protein